MTLSAVDTSNAETFALAAPVLGGGAGRLATLVADLDDLADVAELLAATRPGIASG